MRSKRRCSGKDRTGLDSKRKQVFEAVLSQAGFSQSSDREHLLNYRTSGLIINKSLASPPTGRDQPIITPSKKDTGSEMISAPMDEGSKNNNLKPDDRVKKRLSDVLRQCEEAIESCQTEQLLRAETTLLAQSVLSDVEMISRRGWPEIAPEGYTEREAERKREGPKNRDGIKKRSPREIGRSRSLISPHPNEDRPYDRWEPALSQHRAQRRKIPESPRRLI